MKKYKITGVDKERLVANGEAKKEIRRQIAPEILAKYKESILESIDERNFRNQDAKDILQPYLKYIKQLLSENKYLDRLENTTMMIKILRKAYKETTQRKIHSLVVTKIGTQMAKELGLNVDLAELMLKYHDVGHTFYGHDGEWMISEALEKQGLGVLCHNAEGPRKLLFRENVCEKAINKIKEQEPGIKEWKLRAIRENLWIIFDGILTHNGELAKTTFIPNTEKTEEDFANDLMLCYTQKGADRKIVPGTIEGCLLRISDIISYVGRDFVDGLREGLIDGFDDEYMKIFNSFGITKEQIEEIEKSGNYLQLAKLIEDKAIQDVVASSDKNAIRMSEEMAEKVYTLRAKNNRDIVSKVTKETEQGVFPVAISTIIETGKNILINEGVIAELNSNNGTTNLNEEIRIKYAESPYMQFLNFVTKSNDQDYSFTRKISEIELENAKADSKTTQLSLDDVTAIQMTAQFLASLTDAEFVKFLRETGELTVSQEADLNIKYKDTENSIHSSKYWEANMKKQEEERAEYRNSEAGARD